MVTCEYDYKLPNASHSDVKIAKLGYMIPTFRIYHKNLTSCIVIEAKMFNNPVTVHTSLKLKSNESKIQQSLQNKEPFIFIQSKEA